MTVKAGSQKSRLDPEAVPRRDLLGMASLWSAATALMFALVGALRLPKAAIVAPSSKKFTVTLPESLPAGEAFVPPGKPVAIFRDADGVYALSTTCTHLGCVVKANPEGFECPCHGSRFKSDGTVVKGPAPRALPWFEVTAADGAWIVEAGKVVPPGTKVKA